MRLERIIGLLTLAATLCCLPGTAQTQTSPPNPARLAAIQSKLNLTKQAISQLPAPLQRSLSGAALNMLQFADRWANLDAGHGEGAEKRDISSSKNSFANTALKSSVTGDTVAVSDPFPDFLFSVEAGFTQSETSTSWCGSSVVVGFNDSGSVFESLLLGPGGVSGSGASVSIDGGRSFRDVGFINPGPDQLTFLGGDPIVSCTDSNTFFYSQIGSGGAGTAPTSNIYVSKSTDGGSNWGDPVSAIAKDAPAHFLDKDWSTVDPNDPKRLYVTYTDFDGSGSLCGSSFGIPIERIAIEIVHSADGGVTWSHPRVLDQVCSPPPNFPFVQGSQVAVDAHGNVFVEWEFFPDSVTGSVREFRIAKSVNHSNNFEATSKIVDMAPTGDGFLLQGGFRDFLTGNLAIDRSGTHSDGNLYFTWDDGRIFARPDLESPTGFYHFANVLAVRSADGGHTWSAPVRVNNDPASLPSRRSVDHYQPGIAVDATGALADCWYDRRDDPFNFRIGRFCATSSDMGATWTNVKAAPGNWPAIHAADAIINPQYLGDYDTVVSDQLKREPGFLGAYGNVSTENVLVPNQDVFLTRLP